MRVDHNTRTIYLRQSGLSTYFDCPERARQEWFEGVTEVTSDAAAIGTACHHPIELNLRAKRDVRLGLTTSDMIDLAVEEFNRIDTEEGIRYVQGTYDDAMKYITQLIPAWRSFIEPYVLVDDSLKLEYHFDLFLTRWCPHHGLSICLCPDSVTWKIRLTGQLDCLDRNGIFDWKHKGSAMKQWELQRNDVQSIVYSWAAVELGLLQWPVLFRFGDMRKLKTKQHAELIPVKRWPDHVQWLEQQISGLLNLWAGLGEHTPWPMQDTTVLCSPKWCPAWDTCKGAIVMPERFTWKP